MDCLDTIHIALSSLLLLISVCNSRCHFDKILSDWRLIFKERFNHLYPTQACPCRIESHVKLKVCWKPVGSNPFCFLENVDIEMYTYCLLLINFLT